MTPVQMESGAKLFRVLGADMAIPATEAFRVGKYGPSLDPTGAHVLWDGRLWEATGATYREFPSAFCLTLRTFNREHNATAPMSACKVLVRTYPEDEAPGCDATARNCPGPNCPVHKGK